MTKHKTISRTLAYRQAFRAGQRSRERCVDDMRLVIRRLQDDLFAAHEALKQVGLTLPEQPADAKAVETSARESLLREIETRRGRSTRTRT